MERGKKGAESINSVSNLRKPKHIARMLKQENKLQLNFVATVLKVHKNCPTGSDPSSNSFFFQKHLIDSPESSQEEDGGASLPFSFAPSTWY